MEYIKYYYIAIIVAIVMFGIYETTDLIFNRLEHMQQVSREVVEK